MSRMLSSLMSSPADRGVGSRRFGTNTPELPKRPVNAYLYFVKAELQGKAGGGKATASQWMKDLSSRWKTMSEAEKTPFVSQQARALDEYNRALERIDPKVLESLREASRAQVKVKKVTKAQSNVNKIVKESGRPKAPAGGFALFFTDARSRSGVLSSLSVTEATKRAAGLWKGLSQPEKDEWNNKSKAAREAYNVELEKWQKANPDKVAAIAEAKAQKVAAVAATKPPKPAPVKKTKAAAQKPAKVAAKNKA